jgi:hypothetical protein
MNGDLRSKIVSEVNATPVPSLSLKEERER